MYRCATCQRIASCCPYNNASDEPTRTVNQDRDLHNLRRAGFPKRVGCAAGIYVPFSVLQLRDDMRRVAFSNGISVDEQANDPMWVKTFDWVCAESHRGDLQMWESHAEFLFNSIVVYMRNKGKYFSRELRSLEKIRLHLPSLDTPTRKIKWAARNAKTGHAKADCSDDGSSPPKTTDLCRSRESD